MASQSNKEEAEEKRREISNMKEKRILDINQKLQSIDLERQGRRQKRFSKSISDRGLSSMYVTPDGSGEKDQRVKYLQAQILEKKQSRLALRFM
jgi:hypothetical protein